MTTTLPDPDDGAEPVPRDPYRPGPSREAASPNLHRDIVRCLESVLHYHRSGRTSAARRRMASEVREIALDLAARDLPEGSWTRVIRPVERELKAWYGGELGATLLADFLRAFDSP